MPKNKYKSNSKFNKGQRYEIFKYLFLNISKENLENRRKNGSILMEVFKIF